MEEPKIETVEEMNVDVEPTPVAKTESKPSRPVADKKDDHVHPRALSKWEELERRGLIASKKK